MSARTPGSFSDPQLQALLDLERNAPGPSAAVQQRVLARVELTLGLPPVAPGGAGGPGGPVAAGASGTSAAASGGALAALAGPKGLALAGLLLVGLGGAATLAVRGWREVPPVAAVAGARSPDATHVTAAAAPTAPAQEAPGAGPVPSGGAPALAAPASPAAAPAAPAGPSGGRDWRLAAERSLLEEARRALARGAAADALAVLEQHRQRFPAGRLTEEREALQVLALVRAGRLWDAQQEAVRFRERHEHSILLPAVEQAVAVRPPGAP